MTRLVYDICHVGLSHLSLVINLFIIYIGAIYPIMIVVLEAYWVELSEQEVA